MVIDFLHRVVPITLVSGTRKAISLKTYCQWGDSSEGEGTDVEDDGGSNSVHSDAEIQGDATAVIGKSL